MSKIYIARSKSRRFAAKSHRALGSVGARTPGYSPRPAINRMRGRDRKYNRRPDLEGSQITRTDLIGAVKKGIRDSLPDRAPLIRRTIWSKSWTLKAVITLMPLPTRRHW